MRRYEKELERKCCLTETREELYKLEDELAKLRGFESYMDYCDFITHLYFVLGIDELPFDTSYHKDKWIKKLGR